MITINQCRAARGLLDWTQQDLADASGLSKTAINNFEKGHSDIKMESLRAVRMAFESADVEFTDEDGLRKKSEKAYFLKGEQAIDELLDDIINTMKDKDGEVLVINRNETIAGQTSQKALLDFREKLKLYGIDERVICANSNNGSPDVKSKRWLGEDVLFGVLTTFIYDRKVAIELWDQSLILVLDSREASASERLRFEKLWNVAHETSNSDQSKKAKSAT